MIKDLDLNPLCEAGQHKKLDKTVLCSFWLDFKQAYFGLGQERFFSFLPYGLTSLKKAAVSEVHWQLDSLREKSDTTVNTCT